MTATELRGSFVTLLAEVEDTATLQIMLRECLQILRRRDPLAADFPAELLAELDEAIAQSDDEGEAISNEDAMKLFRSWASA